MMGLTPGPLVRVLLLFAQKNPLVVLTTPFFMFMVFVTIGINLIGEVLPLVVLVTIVVESKSGRRIEIFWIPKS